MAFKVDLDSVNPSPVTSTKTNSVSGTDYNPMRRKLAMFPDIQS
jgi:hypothetical protein